MPKVEFDATGFFRAIDTTRSAKQLNWKQVAEDSGVSASTLTRLGQGKRPDVDSMAALVSWSGLSADAFVSRTGASAKPEALSQIATVLGGDTRLSADARDTILDIVTATYQRLAKSDDA